MINKINASFLTLVLVSCLFFNVKPVEASFSNASFVISVSSQGVSMPINFQLKDLGSGISSAIVLNGSSQNIDVPFGEYELTPVVPVGWKLNTDYGCTLPFFSQAGYAKYTDGSNTVKLVLPNYLSSLACTYNFSKTGKTPVLIVPGMFGTEITKGSELMWVDIERMVNPVNSDSFMDPLLFNENLQSIDNSITISSVLRKIDPLGRFNKYDYTEGLINEFIAQGYVEGEDLFTFPYDWRYGVSEEVVNQLKGQILYILDQTPSGAAAGKVNIVAHSTGGLIVKKYVEENPNSHGISQVIFVGVPNLGSPKAYKVLINGDNFNIPGMNDEEMKKLAQNMPIAYDLAPTQEYFDTIGSPFHITEYDALGKVSSDEDVNYEKTIERFSLLNLINTQASSNSQNLHTQDFDNYDIRQNNIDVFNIVGCKTATFSKFSQTVYPVAGSGKNFDFPKTTSGDGTVPFLSADSIPADGDKQFFVPKADHGTMLSAKGIRQQIVNIFEGTQLDTEGKVLTRNEIVANPGLCQRKGETIKIKSPVDVSAVDMFGNVIGLTGEGSIINTIPGADFEIWGDHKYMFLPTDENQQYEIKLKGTGEGKATIIKESIDHDEIVGSDVFSNIPVTTSFQGSLDVSILGNLQIDNNGDGIMDQVISPVINHVEDDISPQTEVLLDGAFGETGFFRGNVLVALSAHDQALSGSSSGVLKTQYSLDGGEFQEYVNPLIVKTEGLHTIKYFSTDNAGNNETEKETRFVIDITPPEIKMQFNQDRKDVAFIGLDLITATTTTEVSVFDNGDSVRVVDRAGNTTEIYFKEKNRKNNLHAEVLKLLYNGQLADISKTSFKYSWEYTKQNMLKKLEQSIKSKSEFQAQADFSNNQTKIEGKDATGKFKRVINGFVPLILTTNRGDFVWSY